MLDTLPSLCGFYNAFNSSYRYAGQAWVGKNGKLYTFGGFGEDSKGVAGYLDDLWSFSLPCSSDV